MIKRNYKVKIETEEEFFTDLIANAENLNKGVIPEKTVERISFPDLETFYRYCTPKRLQLLKDCTSERRQ